MNNNDMCGLAADAVSPDHGERIEMQDDNRELDLLKYRLSELEKDRDAWRDAACRKNDGDLQGCLGSGRTGLLKAMRDAFA